MAEFSYPFNAVETSPGVFDREYDASHLARAFMHLQNGVAMGVLGSLFVTAGTGLNVSLATGLAFINGIYYYNDSALTKSHDAADPTNNRIDYIALRLDTAARTITSVVLKGTPAATPAPPALSNTATIVEIALYEVLVRAGSTQILATDITPVHRSQFYSTYKPAMDLNVCTQTGWYSGTDITNGPSGVTTGMLFVNQYGNTQANIRSCSQILIDYDTGKMYMRWRKIGTNIWETWKEVVMTDSKIVAPSNTLSLQSGFSHVAGWKPLQYHKLLEGIRVHGSFQGNMNQTRGTMITQLPAGLGTVTQAFFITANGMDTGGGQATYGFVLELSGGRDLKISNAKANTICWVAVDFFIPYA